MNTKSSAIPNLEMRRAPRPGKAHWALGLVLALFAGLFGGAYGQTGYVPDAINYQGKLTNERGEPVKPGSYQVRFKIWKDLNSQLAADLVWSRALPVHVVTNGMFNVLLSGAGPNPLLAAFDGPDRFLGLTIVATPDGNVSELEISPRQRLVSAPFAIHAYNAYKTEWATSATNAGHASSAGTASYATDSGRFANLDTNAFLTVNKPAQTLNGKLVITNGMLTVSGNVTANAFAGAGTIPVGGIIMWSGAKNTIPNGWALCDGSIGTPDLRNRFIVGVGDRYDVGMTGGFDTVTLTIAQMPAHDHGYNARGSWQNGGGVEENHWKNSVTNNTTKAGGGQAHENRPPYYALCYIMRVN